MTRRARQVLLLALVLAAGLGTSRPLRHKQARGVVVSTPEALSVPARPRFRVGENVNNQGCFGDERLDLAVRFAARNTGSKAITIAEKAARVVVDGRSFPIKRRYVGGPQKYERPTPLRTYAIGPGQTRQVAIEAYSFVSLDDVELSQLDRVEVVVPLAAGKLRLRLTGLEALPLRRH